MLFVLRQADELRNCAEYEPDRLHVLGHHDRLVPIFTAIGAF
jgi:hypothetical protein